MPALSPFTLTQPAALLENLKDVRNLGYAMDDQEGSVGMCCLAVPIYDHRPDTVAAISISGASPLFSTDTIPEIASDLKEAAREISLQLGWNGWFR